MLSRRYCCRRRIPRAEGSSARLCSAVLMRVAHLVAVEVHADGDQMIGDTRRGCRRCARHVNGGTDQVDDVAPSGRAIAGQRRPL